MLSLEIARRYLFAHKSQNAINIISGISALGVMVATAALVIVLSVFNGLSDLVTGLFGTFDPDLKIEAAQGKYFVVDDDFRQKLNNAPGIDVWAEVVEDNALVRYGKRQMPAIVMGVSANFDSVTDIDSIIVDGAFRSGGCLVGAILADQLAVSSIAFNPTLTLYAPKRVGKVSLQNPEAGFVENQSMVSGVFCVQQTDYDANYVLADIAAARALFGYEQECVTSICVRTRPGSDAARVGEQLAGTLGPGFVVRDKWQQHASLFRMMKVEKLMAFAILLFIVLIAAFNIIGSLSMLIFEKKESISVLRAMGADQRLVTKVFLFEGWLVSVGGVICGLVIGVLLVLAQEEWGIVGFGDGDYILQAYPVRLIFADVLAVFAAVVLLAVLAAYYPVRSIVGRYYQEAR